MDRLGLGHRLKVTGFLIVVSLLAAFVAVGPHLGSAYAQTSADVQAWGHNSQGQLGNGTTDGSATPVDVSNLTGVVVIGAGGEHSLAALSDGTAWAWGQNANGQLGDGTSSDRITPVQVSGLTGIIQVDGGLAHSLALRDDGTVWGWGLNANGQLGDGTTTDSTTPVQVSGLTGVVAVAAGGDHSVALKSDGTVWAWGKNSDGQLGDGSKKKSSTPVQVSALSGVIAIAAGDAHSLAVKSDGTVWAWGDNFYGQLGDGTTRDRNTPVQATGLTGAEAVAGGSFHSLAVKSDGTVWAWGRNSFGQLGDGTTTDRSTPVQTSNLTTTTTMSAGAHHSLASLSDGTAWAWGFNFYGQLGDGTTTNRSTPVQISTTTPFDTVAAGAFHSLGRAAQIDVSAVWTPQNLAVDVARGSSRTAQVKLVVDADVAAASLVVTGDASSFVSVLQGEDPYPLPGNETIEVVLAVDIPSGTDEQAYTGQVQVVADGVSVSPPLDLTVNVVQQAPTTSGFTPPSGTRILTTPGGNAFVDGELGVILESTVSDPDTEIQQLAAMFDAVPIGGETRLRGYQLSVQASGIEDLRALAASIAADSRVEFASPHYLGMPLAAVPNDPEWDTWDESQPAGNNWHLEYINAPSAWDLSTGNPDVKVAVIDVDIDVRHEDLSANVGGQDGFRVGSDAVRGHGTRVAGVACAVGDNGVGISGVAWACNLIAVEWGFPVITSPDLPVIWFSPFNLAQRMLLAGDAGAQVVNMSWGEPFAECAFSTAPPEEEQARQAWWNAWIGGAIAASEAEGKEILWVAGAGKTDCDARLMTPAALSEVFDNVITVGGISESGDKWSHSPFGPAVNVAAPATNIFSTSPHHGLWFWASNYGVDNGTSYSAPQVTGLASLMLDVNPGASAPELRHCIVSSADQFGASVPGHSFNVINAPGAINCISGAVCDLTFNSTLSNGFSAQNVDPAFGDGFIWHFEAHSNELFKVNPTTGDRGTAIADLPGSFVQYVAYDNGIVYALDAADDLWVINGTTGAIIDTFNLSEPGFFNVNGLVHDGTHLISYEHFDEEIIKYDPSTGAVVSRTPFSTIAGESVAGMEIIGSNLWISTFEKSEIYVVDASTYATVAICTSPITGGLTYTGSQIYMSEEFGSGYSIYDLPSP